MGSGNDEPAKGADVKAAQIIDREQIDGLVAAAGVEGTREILAAYWRSTEGLLRSLQEQLSRADFAEAAKTAHALKGSSLNVGAVMLSASARAIEDSCRTNDAEGALRRLTSAQTRYAETVDAFNTHLATAA